MIQKFTSSQVLIPLTLDKPLKYLRSQRRTKSPLLPWKFQKAPTKMLAKERRLKLSRVRIKVKIRRKILLIPQRKPQILLSLSLAKLLTQGSPRRKLRLGGFYYFCMFFCCFVCSFFSKKCITPFSLSMKTVFFCFICHDMCYKIHCQSMAIFCHFNSNKIYYHIL